MHKKYVFLLFFLLLIKPIQAQMQLSVYSEISIVTVGPGTELYEAFGHAAIRVKDPVLKLDLIYNYGMFDFNQPNFYTNFAKGNMIYSLARYDFKYFLASYKRDKRWVKQQVLNLNKQQKQNYFIFLENNALPENRNYQYDPYFDNCATKLRDITRFILAEDTIIFNDKNISKELTLRDLTNKEIHWNTWGSFGLNLIAGTKLDKKATTEQYMYLPDYVYAIFKDSHINTEDTFKTLVKREDVLLDFNEIEQQISFLNPLLIFSILCLLTLYTTYKDFKNNRRSRYLDFTLLFITGLIGVLLLFLWFFSTHSTAPNNFNILWAFAPNLIIAFLIVKKQPQKWVINYTRLLLLFILFIPFFWLLKVQSFPISVIPVLILLGTRYLFLSKKLN
ncbi:MULTISPECIES: DUF4105 domain-containing protein [unclassified Polaribacter]|uniref:lipoprotein N-acyltransferase Lnb domain-containing protein n=1 Tax=unclassified Polaribacter TaxID=196858 RepID=UPI0011BD4E18|nr:MULTISPECIES: DUF4105 domain-containing protein [unclassified Polaribacter]TXD52856.1 DUF4105 domain-containing protein [Polaribacter sp. IC063]TXD60802.1 DUF4105 domain-containing protein [Polaribacter sp. IC066]